MLRKLVGLSQHWILEIHGFSFYLQELSIKQQPNYPIIFETRFLMFYCIFRIGTLVTSAKYFRYKIYPAHCSFSEKFALVLACIAIS